MKQAKQEYFPLYSYYDRTGISKHLEEMAAKGWLLEKLGLWCWRYRRIAPQRLHFSVTYFPQASQFTPYPSPNQETFWDFCAAAGWVLAAESAQVQVFYNEDENAVPVETDSVVELKNIHHSMKKGMIGSFIALLLISLMQLGMFLHDAFSRPIDLFSDPLRLVSSGSCLPLFIALTYELIHYFHWYHKAKAAANAGFPLPELHSSRTLTILIYILVGAELFALYASTAASRGMLLLITGLSLYMGLMFLLSNAVRNALRHLGAKAWVNILVTYGIIIALTIAMFSGMTSLIIHTNLLDDHPPVKTYTYKGITWDVYADPIPLTIQDLVSNDYDSWSTQLHRSSSPLLTHMEATQRPRMDALNEPDLEYEIVIVKADFLYNTCKRQFIDWVERDNDVLPQAHWNEYRLVDATLWGAEEAYQRYNAGEACNQFLICWPDRIAEIDFDWDWSITPEMMSVAAEQLKTA